MRLSCAVVFLVLFGLPSDSFGCSCISPGPPCENFFRSEAVFIGTVRDIAPAKVVESEMVLERRLVGFDVERVGRGKVGTRAEIYTGFGGGDCGYGFTVGRRYVVYAYRRPDGSLGTGICSRTRPVAEAAEDIAYLTTLPPTGSGARVSGEIKHWEHDAAARESVQYGPVADVQVLVRGSRGTFSATTDAAGKYTIAGIPPGSYEVEALPPPSFSTRYLRRTVEFTDPRACTVVDFSLHFDGRIAGVLQHPDGRPAAGVRLEIVAADRPAEPASIYPPEPVTDATGRFELDSIPPGRYLIAVGFRHDLQSAIAYPLTLLPAAPLGSNNHTAIEVGSGARVDVGVLRIAEPLAPRTITGVVLMPDGSPAVRAHVSLWNVRNWQAAMGVTTDEQGRFAIKGFQGQRYTVRAFLNLEGNRQIHATQSIADTDPPDTIRLILRPR